MKSSGHSCIYDISYYDYWNMNYTDGLYLLQHMCYFLYFGCRYLHNSLLFWKITLYRINQCRFFKCFICVWSSNIARSTSTKDTVIFGRLQRWNHTKLILEVSIPITGSINKILFSIHSIYHILDSSSFLTFKTHI